MMAIFHSELLVYPRVTRGLSCKKNSKQSIEIWGNDERNLEYHMFRPHMLPPAPPAPPAPGGSSFSMKKCHRFSDKGAGAERRMFDVDSIYPPPSNSATPCGDTWHERFFSEQMKPGISPSCGEKRPVCLKPWRREWFI